jgi:hypothetical protein
VCFQESLEQRPYGVALYDFVASQAGDLDLKEGDVVYLTNIINDSWIEGQVGDREGMFPANFLDVKVPLPGQHTNVVNALYTFKAEIADDLSFEVMSMFKLITLFLTHISQFIAMEHQLRHL